MNWPNRLITIYLYVCKHDQQNLWIHSQRMSHYADLSFSNEEVMTLYLFGVVDKHRAIKGIDEYADRHLRDGFPRLPSYVTYVQSLNQVADVFAPLLALVQQEQEVKNPGQAWLIDSFAVVLATGKVIGLKRV
jgi:hypothetical protein